MSKTRSVRSKRGGSTRKRKSSSSSKHNMIRSFIQHSFSLQLTLKMVHWTTKSYAVHKATDKSMAALMPLIDSFVESFLGKHNYELKQNEIKNIAVKQLRTASEFKKYIKENVEYLVSLNEYIRAEEHSDLVSIRDSIVSELNVLNYLLDLEE